MGDNTEEFFIVNHLSDDKGAPSFFASEWTPPFPEFHYPSELPGQSDFASSYFIKAKTNLLEADYLVDELLASDAMLELVETLKVPVITCPISIELYRKKTPSRRYNLLIPTNRLAILDQERSIFEIDADKYTGKLLMPSDSGTQEVIYARIDKFIIRKGIESHLFYCMEIKETVCSRTFKNAFESHKLTGVKFMALDASYRYDPWADFC